MRGVDDVVLTTTGWEQSVPYPDRATEVVHYGHTARAMRMVTNKPTFYVKIPYREGSRYWNAVCKCHNSLQSVEVIRTTNMLNSSGDMEIPVANQYI